MLNNIETSLNSLTNKTAITRINNNNLSKLKTKITTIKGIIINDDNSSTIKKTTTAYSRIFYMFDGFKDFILLFI